MFEVLARMGAGIDRAIGASELRPGQRDTLYAHQLRSCLQMAPMLLGASVASSIVLLFVTLGQPAFGATLLWAAVINGVYLYGYLVWRRVRLTAPQPETARAGMVGLLFYCGILGVLWGMALNIVPLDDMVARTAVLIAVPGMLSLMMLALINMPQAVVTFLPPLLGLSFYAFAGVDSPIDQVTLALLFAGFVAVLLPVSLRHAKTFVAHHASLNLVHEKGEIIGLLLKEFEDSTSDWIWGFDVAGRIDRVSKGFTAATGLPESELLGADFLEFLHYITPPNDTLMQQLERAFLARQPFSEVEIRVMSGTAESWWRLTGKPILDTTGQYAGYIGTTSDVSLRKQAERRITMLAHNDPLTGLLNRTKFTEHLNQCVARLERYGSPFCILFLDLDQFKAVNDGRGHLTGDRLLQQVSRRVQNLLRENDIVARLGGDEFAVIVTSDVAPANAAALAQRLIDEIRRPYEIDDETITIGVSIGIAIAPVNGTRPDQLLRNADLALYRAKADGRSVYRFFEAQMDFDARERRMLEIELREALGKGELVLHYQPLVSAEDRRPTGFEALIRWHHPIRGLVSPAEFIPIAEQSNLIIEIGDWTIHQACMAAANWPEHLTVAVNLSAKHFKLSEIPLVVKKALAVSGLAPHRLEIEITESLLMENPDLVTEKLEDVRQLGVTIVMDDFGTGYSSLSYLLKFPFDKIKIDKSFVDASTEDAVARDILRAIASLGKTLKLRITAEGVETREQAEFLSEIACHQLQGFFFARPLDGLDLPQYLLTQVMAEAAATDVEPAADRLTG